MLLEAKGVEVFYEKVQALWDLNLHVENGEIVALLGANGAGKSTVLKAISGLQQIDKGGIYFGGEEITQAPAYQIVNMGISHVPEGRRIFAQSTVLRNLEMGAYIRRREKDFTHRTEKCFELFPVLKGRLKQMAGTLSGGEQQMLAIARGIVNDPKLLMLDEPSMGLAPKVVQDVFKTIITIHSNGIAVLVLEQNVRQTLEMADRAYVLQNGRIVLSGNSSEILAKPEVKKAYLGI
jgi:branched-chain amino acid transport system ATP-binding protein